MTVTLAQAQRAADRLFPPQCDARTRPRRLLIGYSLSRRCPNPARFRVRSADPSKMPWGPEQPCGRHVRPYLMDNGDSVRKPWIVEPIVKSGLDKPEAPE